MSTRVVFVGQVQYFEACSMPGSAAGITPVFVDHRGGRSAAGLVERLHDLDPDVVVIFRPEIMPPGSLDGLRALRLGYNTEPLPRAPTGAAADGELAFRLSELRETDLGQFDRVMTFDPLSATAAEQAGIRVWRSMPLPVDDRFYAPERLEPGRAVFFAAPTEHRERWLLDAKHRCDVLHVAHGIHGEKLRTWFGRTSVAINVHYEPFPSFENRVCLHLAAGHLVISEPLSPTHGLEPGIDFLEVRTPGALTEAVAGALAHPDAHRAVRLRGRRKAESFRASRVWPRVIADLRRDVAAFGRGCRGPFANGASPILEGR